MFLRQLLNLNFFSTLGRIPHSFFVKLVIGLLITVSHLLHFIFCQKNAPLHTPSTKIQECPRAGLQIKSARIPIFSDLTIEILTLTFPTRWQKRAVIHLIFYFYNIYNQFCPECNKIVLSLFSIMQHLVIFTQTRICKNIYPLYKTDQSLLLPPVTGKLSRPA